MQVCNFTGSFYWRCPFKSLNLSSQLSCVSSSLTQGHASPRNGTIQEEDTAPLSDIRYPSLFPPGEYTEARNLSLGRQIGQQVTYPTLTCIFKKFLADDTTLRSNSGPSQQWQTTFVWIRFKFGMLSDAYLFLQILLLSHAFSGQPGHLYTAVVEKLSLGLGFRVFSSIPISIA